MRKIWFAFFIPLWGASVSAQTLTGVWFEVESAKGRFYCSTMIIGDADGTERYGPIVVAPIELEKECTVGTQSTTRFSESGVQKSSTPRKKWHVVFRDLEMEAEPGTVYLVTKAGKRYVMQVLLLDVTRSGEGPDLRQIVQNVLAVGGPDFR